MWSFGMIQSNPSCDLVLDALLEAGQQDGHHIVFVAIAGLLGIDDLPHVVAVPRQSAISAGTSTLSSAEVRRDRLGQPIVFAAEHELGAGKRRDVAVAGRVDEGLGEHQALAGFGADDQALAALSFIHDDARHHRPQQDLDAGLLDHLDDDALHHFGVECAGIFAPVGFADAAVRALVANAAVEHFVEDRRIDQPGRLGQPSAGDQAAEKARCLRAATSGRPRAPPGWRRRCRMSRRRRRRHRTIRIDSLSFLWRSGASRCS